MKYVSQHQTKKKTHYIDVVFMDSYTKVITFYYLLNNIQKLISL